MFSIKCKSYLKKREREWKQIMLNTHTYERMRLGKDNIESWS